MGNKVEARVVELLAETAKEKRSVFYSSSSVDISFQTLIHKITPDAIHLENRVKPAFISAAIKASDHYLQVHMIRFQAKTIATDGVDLIFPLTKNSVTEETRQAERFPFADEERVVCEILNPIDGETKIVKAVLDMSATGLSIRTTFASLLFAKGMVLPSIRVLINGESYSQSSGTIVYSRKIMDLQGRLRNQVGIKFHSTENKQ
jgi:hypothetical protein